MSTSLRRSVGSTATRKVIGWSLPSTLPTAAKPSSESARDTRSTLPLSTCSVSTRAPGPNSRAIDAATFAGGPPGVCAVSSNSASARLTSKLVADAEAQHLALARPGRVAQQPIVPLERRVPGGLVGDTHCRDPARQGPVPRHAGGDARLGVVALVAEECVELLGGRRSEQPQQVVGPLEVAAGDAAADGLPVRGVDRLGVAHADGGDDDSHRERPVVVARVRGEERHRSSEGPGPDCRVRIGRPPVPKRAADLDARARPLEPPRHRWVREARLAALLASLPNPLAGRKTVGAQPVHEIHPIREPAATGNGPDRADADLAPGGGNHVVVEAGALHAVEGRRLVRLVHDADRRQDEPRAKGDPARQAVVQVGLLERHFPARPPPLELRVLDFELGPEGQSIIEAVCQIDDETGEVDDRGGLGTGGVGVMHFTIAPHGGAFLGGENPDGTGRHDRKQAPPDERPHHHSVAKLVENGYQTEITEFISRDSDGQAAVIVVRTMSLILVALVTLLAGGLGWGAVHLKRRLERSERDRRRAADELNRRLSELFSLQELSYILAGSLQLDRIVEQVVRYAMRFLDAQGALVALAAEGEGGGERPLRVTAAEGTLAGLAGRAIAPTDPGLVVRSLSRERLELVRSSSGEPTRLLGDVAVDSAAAVSLRAHGVVVGTLVIANPRDRTFPPEDMRLLSTVATHAAIVIANARFFQMVQHAKEQWETAFDALSEGIAVVDDHGRITRSNRALAAMLGSTIPAVIGCDLSAALLGSSAALLELLAAARQGDRVQPVVLRSATLGRTIRVNAARIPAPAHDQSVVVLVEDVTDQQALEAQLIQSEKLASVGQLVSGVAHELNNPLTSIAGLSEFLLEQQELGTKDRGHLRVIHEQADRAGRIVRNLLTFAREGPGEHAAVDLNDVIQRTLLLMSYDLTLKDVTIEKNLAPLPAVLGDRHALQQVVINLLNNAAQAVAENPPERPRVILLSTWGDDRVRMRVTDSGSGIPDAVLPHLFTPFFTTKEPGQGTGLGLSITYSIVEAHGGRITVERPAEGGAAFLVDLPPAPTLTEAARRETAEPAVAPPATKRSILLVDDDPAEIGRASCRERVCNDV